ncbi:formate dehydrogenase subunit alpha [Caldilinea sp.]|jgi:formate dehydrogenase alpha subunit|uniref:formate dehydrogenase subunit alpha n=1 Tax=Caldilinea sp. TaxID=2293560 RepID=UPI001B2CB3E1|nr:formate dehydrogenase subunit alpha [Caldilinea sp.]MBO9391429.1 formate dehydrogenase subunit alpha [Caldilinea sp.]
MIKPDRIVSTTCPYCGVGCNLQLHVKDDFIYRITSPHDAVVNKGNLCVKGRFGYDFMYHPDRVTTPLIRKTPQAPGRRTQAFDRSEWREVSWDEALDYVADRLVEIYRRDGPKAMAVYCCAKATNEDNYLLQKMFRALFRTNNVDHCTRLCHAGSVVALQMALGTSAMSNTAAEVIYSDCFIVTGSNTTENHPIIALQMKEAVRKHGARLIVIDPRRLELCDYAALWLPLKPGTNVPVFSAMAHVIVKEGLINREFIEKRTIGFEEYARSLEPFTPEYAEKISGVDRSLIIEAARMYATARNGAIYWGMGISQFSNGTASALGLIHLALLTGHIGRRGTGLNPLRGQNNVQGASDAGAMPFHYPGYMEVDKEENARKWEQLWNIEPGGLSRQRGLTTTEILSHAHPGGVRALYIMGENPMMTEPNLNVTRKHMEQLEFLVAQDIFINESGAFADVFLPAASWAEKEGTFTNTDRRVQRVRRAIAPRGQSRPDSEIICDLAKRIERRLGRPTSAGWDYASPEEVFREMASVATMLKGITYARIEKEGLQYPVPDETHPGTPFLFAESFPSGRGRFFPLEYVPVAEEADEEYPFILTTGRLLEHWHGGTLTRHSQLNELSPTPKVEMHEIDAARLSVKTGDAVRVSSRRGSVVLRVEVSPKARPGVVFIPMHFAEAAANLLTIDVLDPQAKIPEFKACAVNIQIAEPEEAMQVPELEPRGRY